MRSVLVVLAGLTVLTAPAAFAAAPGPARASADRLITAAEATPEEEPTRAKAAWTEALAAARAAYPADSEPVARALNGYAAALHQSGDAKAAIEAGKQAEAIMARLPQGDARLTADILGNIGVFYGSQQDFANAEPYLKRSHELRLKTYPPNDPEIAWSHAELAAVATRLGRWDEGLVGFAAAVEIDRAALPPGHPVRVDHMLHLGNALTFANEHRRAEAVLREVVEEARLLPAHHPARPMAIEALAAELLVQGRASEAADVYLQSIALRRKLDGGRPEDLADALGSLGYVRLMQERPEDAEPLFLEARTLFETGGANVSAAAVLMAAGTAAAQRGDKQLGLERRQAALDYVTSQPNPNPVAVGLFKFKLADSYADTGQLKLAEETETAAIEVIKQIRPEGHYQRLNAAITLGWIQALQGDTSEGLAKVKASVERTVTDNRRLEIAQVKTSGVQENLEPLGRALLTGWLAGDKDFGFYMAQVLIESDAGRAAAAENARLAAGSGALAETLGRRRTAMTERVRLDGEYLRTLSGDAEKASLIAARMKQLETEAEAAQAILDRDFPEHEALTRPSPITIAEAQRRLDPGEALVVPVATAEGLFVLALTRTDMTWDRSMVSRREVRALIRRVRDSLAVTGAARAGVDASGASGPARAGFDRQAAFQLHQAIFTPEIRRLTDGAKVYSLAADSVFSALPFSLLVTSAPTGLDSDPAALRATSWLIRKAALQVAPSIPAMRPGVQGKARPAAFFGAGAPALQGGEPVKGAAAYFRDGSGDLAQLKSLPPLPGALNELDAMARAFGRGSSRVLTGQAATETAVKAADLSQARVVAFATHGLVAGDLDGLSEPALVFTPPASASTTDDGLLTASEAAQLKLDADWVILSACNTALGDTPGAPGYTGLARAFLLAGGRAVLASHWPVRDDAAARLTVDTVKGGALGGGPAQALRRAMLALMDDRHTPGAADPSVWGPFAVVGR